MGTAATAKGKRTLQRRRIIQRPRLVALLDDSNARVRMLVAAAGYGKTTLAEQWVATNGRRSAWYTVRRSSVDVAALALGIARACTSIVPGCDERLRAHLKAVSAPAGSSTILAEILSEDFTGWPSDAWLVIDDYQEISASSDAESFISELISDCPLHVLLTSRQRPSWVKTRSILYGEILEVGQASLAMDPQEAAEVLASWSGPAASGLVALANGWPAVIGLASVSSAEIEGDGDAPVPEALYRFFAEEVFDALDDEVRGGLTLLAVAPVLDRVLAGELLGEERSDAVCGAALDIGILVERNSRLELHPLARSFLEERGVSAPSRPAIEACLRHYHEERDWDAAFDLIIRRELPEELERLLADALEDLLDAARLSTIEEWCDGARAAGIEAPLFALARAETALRQGRQPRAQAYAEVAARSPELAFRAFSLAGRAAHLASHEKQALELHHRAEAAARSEEDRREARWNEVVTAIDLNPDEARKVLQVLMENVDPGSPREFVKASTCNISLGARSGVIDLALGEIAWELLPLVSDPLITTSFQSIYASTLAVAARYSDALEVARALMQTAEHFHLEFARPYALIPSASAHAGMRQWGQAEECLDRALVLARADGDVFVERVAYAARLRALVQQGHRDRALALSVPEIGGAIPVVRAEVLASRGLVLAAADRLEEATEIAKELNGTRSGVEAMVLYDAITAILSLKRNEPDALERVHILSEAAFTRGGLDLLITVYRAVPEILDVLMRDPRDKDRVGNLLAEAGDVDLLEPLGHAVAQGDRRRLLTPRELEVYNLLCMGHSNRQIASILVVSESTAKLHVQHVYNKLGVHSRKALAVEAALERSTQATSATERGGSDSPEA